MHTEAIGSPAMPADALTPESGPPASSNAGAPESFRHLPVLLDEVLSLVPEGARVAVDCTLGGGGHAEALLRAFPGLELFGCDRDPAALAAASQRLQPFRDRILLKQAAFADLGHQLFAGSTDFMLGDLGVSSHQLDQGERGFSFAQDGPLDMRMDPRAKSPTAAELVNQSSHEDLVQLLRRFGEERFAPRIVSAILARRIEAPFTSTRELAKVVAGAVPGKFHRPGHNPATRTFQALRIAVNDELGQLEALLELALHLLRPGGRLAVISFHSLEDRPVKERFRTWADPCECPKTLPRCICGKLPLGRMVTRKPIVPGEAEKAANPRSRSAKLRCFELGPLQSGTSKQGVVISERAP